MARVVARIGWSPRAACVVLLVGAGWFNRRPRNHGQRRKYIW